MSRYTADHRRRPARRCSPRSASARSRSSSTARSPPACGSDAPLDLPAGHARAGRLRAPARRSPRATSRRGRDHLPRRRHVRPLRPGAHRHAHGALGVPDAVHALPARDLPGRAAGDVRVPDGDQRADRRCRSPTRRVYEGPSAVARRRLPGASSPTAAAARRLARACTRTRARRCARYAHGYGARGRRGAAARRRHRPRRVGGGDRRRHERGRSSSSRTSSARSRTPRRWRPPPRTRRRVVVGSYDPIPLGILKPPGECGVDVAVGEGQTLGNRLDFGGPSFGFFAATEAYLRRMPGRIAGETRRRRRAPRLRADAADARAAHPPREGDVEHLHRAGAQRAGRRRLPDAGSGARGLVELGELLLQRTHYARETLTRARRRRGAARAAGRARVRACALDAGRCARGRRALRGRRASTPASRSGATTTSTRRAARRDHRAALAGGHRPARRRARRGGGGRAPRPRGATA